MGQTEIKPLPLKASRLLYRSLALTFFLLTIVSNGYAQQRKGKQIKIKQAKNLKYSKGLEKKNRLIGDVIFEHEGALMYCDSAWLYDQENRIRAFRNIRINQGDTLFLWGDYLDYSGNTKIAEVSGDSVRLKDPEMELTTDRLNLDRRSNTAFYLNGGRIVNEENVLTSIKGYYNTSAKIFNFKDSVVLTNPDYIIESDTLIYNTNNKFSYFHGPTTITGDSSYIYCENGVYDTKLDIAQFEENAQLNSKEKFLKGDSLYYEARNDIGEVFENVFIEDTVDKYIITGSYGWYNGKIDSAFVTGEPLYSMLEKNDTLHIHGDTLQSSIIKDSLGEYRLLRIFHGVRFFRKDLQGQCDSLTYSTRDSILRMYYNPILWNDSSQITGDTIYLTMRNKKLDSLKVYGNSFILSIVDSTKHNQIKGRVMFGKFANNELYRVLVNGNGQTIYYPKDDKGEFIGMNKSVSSYIIITLKDNQVYRISFKTKPEVKLHALDKVSSGDKKLEGFKSYFNQRPKSKKDLF